MTRWSWSYRPARARPRKSATYRESRATNRAYVVTDEVLDVDLHVPPGPPLDALRARLALAHQRSLVPLRGSSVVDCFDAKPLELFKVVPHVLEHRGGVWLPVQDLGNYSQWLPGAVGPRRVAREHLVRQVGITLKGPMGFTRVGPGWSLAYREFRSPSSRVQGCGQVDVVRLPSLTELELSPGSSKSPGYRSAFVPWQKAPESLASDGIG